MIKTQHDFFRSFFIHKIDKNMPINRSEIWPQVTFKNSLVTTVSETTDRILH